MALTTGTPLQPGDSGAESRSLLPWLIAGAVVLVVIGVLLALGRHGAAANPGGAGLAPPSPYAQHLAFSGISMSESTNSLGGKVTYLDGKITNRGADTLRSITVQVAFDDVAGQLAQKNTLPLNLIRTREPYVDTEPVASAPIRPADTREFRLIFDQVTPQWNGAYPEVRVIAVSK
jgi:hypothetical protein